MSVIWFLLWFILSAILLGATGWSTIILFQQKRAWQQYAKIKGLSFDNGTMFGPCTMEGAVGDYNLSFFTAVQQNEDERKNRQLTVMQVTANAPFVDGIAMGTKEMFPFLRTLDAISPHAIESPKWDKKNAIRSRNKHSVNVYLDEQRIAIFTQILNMPNSDVLIVLDDREGVFRFETSNPLKDVKQIDSVINKLIVRIKKLQPSVEEQNRLIAMKSMGDEGLAASGIIAEPLNELTNLAGGLELEIEEDIQDAIEEAHIELEEEEAGKEIEIEYINSKPSKENPQ